MDKEKKDVSPYFIGAVFFAVFFLHLFLAVIWQKRFLLSIFNNSISFMEAISRAYQNFKDPSQGFSIFFTFPWEGGIGNYWPPGVPIVGTLALLILPVRWFFLPNFFYLAMTMLGIYSSAKFLTGNRVSGILAAVIFSCYWSVTIQLVAFDVLLAATACVVWAFYWYLRSDFFTRLWPSFLVGVFMVLGLYCDRVTPGLFVLAFFLVPQNFRNKKSWFLMSLVLVFVGACAWPFYTKWFWDQFRDAGAVTRLFSQYGDIVPPAETYMTVFANPRFLWTHLSYYFISLTEKLMGYGFTALCVFGLFSLRRLRLSYGKVLWIAMGAPLFLFMIIIKKDYPYIFPLCVYFAMVTGIGISFVRRTWARYFLIFLIVGLIIAQYFLFFYPEQRSQRGGMLFSGYFKKIKVLCPLKLSSVDLFQLEEKSAERFRSIVEQILFQLDRQKLSGGKKQLIMVDLKSLYSQHVVVFLIRMLSPERVVQNTFFPERGCYGKIFSESDSYLLSDKEKFAFNKAPGSGGRGPRKGLVPLCRIPFSRIILYKVGK